MSVSSSHIYILEVGARWSTVAPHEYFCWYIGSHWWWRAVARLVVPPTPARLFLWHLPMLSQVYENVSLSYKPPVWPRLATLKDRHRFSFVFIGSDLPVCLLMSTSFLFPILHVCLSFPPNGLIPHTLLISLFPQVPNLGVAYLAHGLSPGFDQVLAKVIFSSGGSTKGGSTCSCWQDSVHHRLWDWGPHFLIGCGPVFP